MSPIRISLGDLASPRSEDVLKYNVTPFNVPNGNSNAVVVNNVNNSTGYYSGGTTNTISWTEIIRQARTQ